MSDKPTKNKRPLVVRKPRNDAKVKLNLAEALELRFEKKWTLKAIGEKYGVSETYVSKRIRKLLNLVKDPEIVEGYDAHKKHILSAAELAIIEKILENEKLDSANLSNLAYAFKQITDANRLERGKSTSNVALSLEERISMLDGKNK